MGYAIYSSLSPLTAWTDPSVRLVGSMGSYILKFDKTIAVSRRIVYLRATTRGLNTVDQQLEITICPRSGGFTYTKPAAYSPTSFEGTGGVTINLAANSLF